MIALAGLFLLMEIIPLLGHIRKKLEAILIREKPIFFIATAVCGQNKQG